MSEYIVNERCLNNIVNFLIHEGYKCDRYYTNGECAELIKERGYDLAKGYDSERLLRDMRILNIFAVDGRHPEEDYGDFMDKEYYEEYGEYDFRYRSNKPNIYLVLTSIHSWLDQCKGIDWNEGGKLCGAFRKMIDIINASIKILQYPYKVAVWRQPYTNK